MLVFIFIDTPTTDIYTLSLHDALPIFARRRARGYARAAPPTRSSAAPRGPARLSRRAARDRKSTRLNSSHVEISYAVFCLKKKKTNSMFVSRSTHFRSTFILVL